MLLVSHSGTDESTTITKTRRIINRKANTTIIGRLDAESPSTTMRTGLVMGR